MSDFPELVRLARQRELSTGREVAANSRTQEEIDKVTKERANQEARVALQNIWTVVARAMVAKSPQPDTMLVDTIGIREFGDTYSSLIKKNSGYAGSAFWNDKSKRRLEAAKQAAIASHSFPAWDMMASITYIGRYADMPSAARSPMFLGSDAAVYYRVSPDHGLNQGSSFRPGEYIPDEYVKDWQRTPGTGIHNYEEIKTGLANLVAKHNLSIGL